ncbi:hypothetical protein KEM52_002919 [Ascosphaera acerosa]|nr:hypothetical protein KEM52_002919 [Ascosphaera acerosa]
MADTHPDALPADLLAAETVELLDARLRRLEYLLTGDVTFAGEARGISRPANPAETAAVRLRKIEAELRGLAARIPAVRDLLRISPTSAPDTRFPDLFQTPPREQLPSLQDPQTLVAIIFSYATAFPETASRLTALQDLPVPPAADSAALVALQPRLDALAAEHARTAHEVAALRAATAALMQRWVEVGAVGGSELWSEWEARIAAAERAIRQHEVQMQRAAEEI